MMAQLVALGESWSGGAQATFQGAVAQWQGAQAQVEAALDAISSQLQTAAALYSDAEARSTALFAG